MEADVGIGPAAAELVVFGLTTSPRLGDFYYAKKPNTKEKGSYNNHPTVKPITLLKYLTKLITPPEGTVLDPFMGSGSTGLAALSEGFNFIGIENNDHYFEIAKRRLDEAS